MVQIARRRPSGRPYLGRVPSTSIQARREDPGNPVKLPDYLAKIALHASSYVEAEEAGSAPDVAEAAPRPPAGEVVVKGLPIKLTEPFKK